MNLTHSLKKLDPRDYRWRISEACPYSSGDQRGPWKNTRLADGDSCGLNGTDFKGTGLRVTTQTLEKLRQLAVEERKDKVPLAACDKKIRNVDIYTYFLIFKKQ